MVTAPKQFSHILGLLSKETSKKKGLKLKNVVQKVNLIFRVCAEILDPSRI